jgi:ribulose-phosphate 3-epimerase
VHLFVERPAEWADPFAEAGADLILIHAENAPEQQRLAAERIAARGCQLGVAFQIETPLAAVEADAVLLLGTRMGVKGQSLDAAAYGRLRQARSLMPDAFLIADGAIRENTVSDLRAAGADAIVPGSLLVGSPDRAVTARWLRSL